MLINKRPDVVKVHLEGKGLPHGGLPVGDPKELSLEGYEVRVLDASGADLRGET
jgi:hypothetical protein